MIRDPFLDIARVVDTQAVRGWRLACRWSNPGWRWFVRWLRSPWFYAFIAASQFAIAAFFSTWSTFSSFGLGVLWLYIGFRQAVRGPEPVELKRHDPQALGLFRIRALMILLVVAILANHSDYGTFPSIAYFFTAALLVWGIDEGIKR